MLQMFLDTVDVSRADHCDDPAFRACIKDFFRNVGIPFVDKHVCGTRCELTEFLHHGGDHVLLHQFFEVKLLEFLLVVPNHPFEELPQQPRLLADPHLAPCAFQGDRDIAVDERDLEVPVFCLLARRDHLRARLHAVLLAEPALDRCEEGLR